MGEIASAYVSIYPKVGAGFASTIRGDVQKAMPSALGPVEKMSGDSGKKAGSRFGTAFKSAVGPMMALASVGAISSFVKSAVDSFASLEDATAAAGVTFGDSMDLIQAKANGASSALGISKKDYIDGALTMGTFVKSAGLAGEDLAAFSNELVQTAGDMASFRGTTPEQAIEAVGSALRGEMEPIRQYGVMLDDASLRQQAMSMGLIKSTKEALTPANKVLSAQALILAKTKDAQGDFARTSDSTANVQKRLRAETENFNAALGEKLAPTIVEVQQGLSSLMGVAEDNQAVLGPLTDTARGLAPAFSDVSKAMSGGTEAGKFLKPVLDSLNSITGIKWVQDLSNAYIGWSGSADTATEAAKNNTAAKKADTSATESNTGATKTNSQILQENIDKLNKQYDARLKLRGDKRSLEAAIDGATESIKKNGKTLDIHTEKGRANQESLDGIAEAGKAVGGNMDYSRNAYIRAAKAMGMSDAAARKLAKSIGLIKSKKVDITASVKMNPSADQVTYSVAGHGNVKFTARARGGYTPPGWTLVGEEGPELRRFTEPSHIYSAGDTQRMLGSGRGLGGGVPQIQMNIQGPDANEVAARAAARLSHVLADMAVQ